jgi:hypothetical protein
MTIIQIEIMFANWKNRKRKFITNGNFSEL